MHFVPLAVADLVLRATAILDGADLAVNDAGYPGDFITPLAGMEARVAPIEWMRRHEVVGVHMGNVGDSESPLPRWMSGTIWGIDCQGSTSMAWAAQPDFVYSPPPAVAGWHIDYRPAPDVAFTFATRPLEVIRDDLKAQFSLMSAFCRLHNIGFETTFDLSLAVLEADQTSPEFHQARLSSLGWRLFRTAQVSQVFTGMGNWADNSYGPDLDGEVETMTGALFDLLAEGLSGAVNRTAPA